MKKIIFLSILCVLMSGLFTGCIDIPETTSVYSESWFDKKGYITYTEDPFEGEILDTFYATSTSVPEGQDAYPAKKYYHRYLKNPTCTFYVQNWQTDYDNDIINYETIKTYRFGISSTPQEAAGFWFWRDEENVYIINTLYNDDFIDRKATAAHTSNDYRFKFDITGICDLTIEMTEKTKKHKWEDD